MKKLIGIALAAAAIGASQANATYYSLQSCNYQYVPEYSKNVYIGIYRSQYGNTFTKTFDSYCPASLNG